MKGIQSNGFLPIIAQAIAEMEELHGEFASINEIDSIAKALFILPEKHNVFLLPLDDAISSY